MKRRDILYLLNQAGFVFVRSGGKHDVYGKGSTLVSVPRHNEIKEPTAWGIMKDAGIRRPR